MTDIFLTYCFLFLLSPASPSGGWGLEAADAAAAAADGRVACAGLYTDLSCKGLYPCMQNSSGQPRPGYFEHMPGERAAGHP